MGLKLSKLKEKTLPLMIDLGDGDELNITYAPGKYTPDFLDKLQEAQLSGNLKESLVSSVLNLIESWDFIDDAGKVLPLNEEVMRFVPIPVISAISTAIGENLIAPKSMTTGSGGSFAE